MNVSTGKDSNDEANRRALDKGHGKGSAFRGFDCRAQGHMTTVLLRRCFAFEQVFLAKYVAMGFNSLLAIEIVV